MDQYYFDQALVISILSQLNIKSNNKINKKGWLGILCPLPSHGKPDKHFGNCSINVSTGVISCFGCGQSKSIISLYMETFNLDYDTAIEQIFSNKIKTTYKKESKEEKDVQQFDSSIKKWYFEHIEFDPEKYFYTKSRGFTKEFCQEFNIRHCISFPYMDYFIIPIEDKSKKIQEFECRRLMEYEYLCKLFKAENLTLNRLQSMFNQYIKKNNIELKEGKLFINNKQTENDTLYYLLRNKVLYPSDSKIKHTLWNIDNLKRNSFLYLSEGMGSIPKIFTYISNNCTTIFGAKIYKAQIDYLNTFENVIHLPDPDIEGFNTVKLLSQELKNNYLIKDVKIKDTHKDYVSEIKKSPLLTPTEYFSKNLQFHFSKL